MFSCLIRACNKNEDTIAREPPGIANGKRHFPGERQFTHDNARPDRISCHVKEEVRWRWVDGAQSRGGNLVTGNDELMKGIAFCRNQNLSLP